MRTATALSSFVIFLLVALPGFSQSTFQMELSAGAGSGWWNYNKGRSEDGSHLGWDHTSTRAFVNTGINVIYKVNRWGLGAGTKGVFFLTDNMLAGDHSLRNYRKYTIAEKYVKFLQFYILSEYDLFKGQKYALIPQLLAGSFLVDTHHPQNSEMGVRLFFEIGAGSHIKIFKELYLIIRPSLQSMVVFGNKAARDDEKHQLYNFNLNTGLRYVFL